METWLTRQGVTIGSDPKELRVAAPRVVLRVDTRGPKIGIGGWAWPLAVNIGMGTMLMTINPQIHINPKIQLSISYQRRGPCIQKSAAL